MTVRAYDAPVNLLPVDVDVEGELDHFTQGQVAYFDVAEEIPLLLQNPDGKIVKKDVVTAGIPTTREMRARTVENPTVVFAAGKDTEVVALLADETAFVDAFVKGKISGKVVPADFVLCVEVAEHIQTGLATELFVANLQYLGKKGMVLSWAGEELCGLGWGHVNCLKMEVKELVESKTRYKFDKEVTSELQNRSDISWIKKSVSFFRKPVIMGDGELYDSLTGSSGRQNDEDVDSMDEEDAANPPADEEERLTREAKSLFRYYRRVVSIREKAKAAEPVKPEETKHQKDRASFVKKIITAPILELKFAGSSLTKDRVVGEGQFGPNVFGREVQMFEELQHSAGVGRARDQQLAEAAEAGRRIEEQRSRQGGGEGAGGHQLVGVATPIEHQPKPQQGVATPVDLRFVASGKPMGVGGGGHQLGSAAPAGGTSAGSFRPGALPSSGGAQFGGASSMLQPGRVLGQTPSSIFQHQVPQHHGAPPQQPPHSSQINHQPLPNSGLGGGRAPDHGSPSGAGPLGAERGTMEQRIAGTMDSTRELITKGIKELDRINAMHRARRPTNEPEPNLLNYERVFRGVDEYYSYRTEELGLHQHT